MGQRLHNLANAYVNRKSLEVERRFGIRLDTKHRDIVRDVYIEAYKDALRHAESCAIYSSKDVLDRIRELKEN